MAQSPSPCRLFVIPARDAEVAVILRRGPTRWMQVVKWDMSSNRFEDGAWFHGRIYEPRCDLSPDGELFVYLAAKHQRERVDDSYGYAWTAVSRPPWLTALALWPSHNGTYGGGGRFQSDSELVVRTLRQKLVEHPSHRCPRWLKATEGDAECHYSSGEVPDTDWSGRDHRNRIIYTVNGKLFRRHGVHDRELADFNSRIPDPQPAPAWAQRKTHSRNRR